MAVVQALLESPLVRQSWPCSSAHDCSVWPRIRVVEGVAVTRDSAAKTACWTVPPLTAVVCAFAGGAAAVVAGVLLIGAGSFLFVGVSDRERPDGWLAGSLRAAPKAAWRRSLWFDVWGLLLIIWASL